MQSPPPPPPGTPPPGPPPPGSPPPEYGGRPSGQSNGLNIASMVLGIVSIPLCLCWGLGFVAGVIAVILGFIGKKRAEQGQATNRGMAMTGIITGFVGIGLAIIAWILLAVGNTTFDWTDNT